MKTVVTITGIRPDFIRMSKVFKLLDQNFNHILIHTGQHYDDLLSGVFFNELQIRKPDYTLDTGKSSSNHYEQLSYLSTQVPKLFQTNNIKPDLILFLGDSNTACVALPLKKEGYKIGHIEAGMRSFDKRMLEEINRTVCDHCSDILFVYHEEYKNYLTREGITNNVHVVGNTIVEPCSEYISGITSIPKRNDTILIDIHRPENFRYPQRLKNIIAFANRCQQKYNLPVKLLYFKRLQDTLNAEGIELGNIEMIPLMSFKAYLDSVYHCKFIISDSGTAQEEPALLNTAVVVPRDFSERPQSYQHNCSTKFTADEPNDDQVFTWLDKIFNKELTIDTSWLGDGNTAQLIIDHISNYLR